MTVSRTLSSFLQKLHRLLRSLEELRVRRRVWCRVVLGIDVQDERLLLEEGRLHEEMFMKDKTGEEPRVQLPEGDPGDCMLGITVCIIVLQCM